MSFGKLGAITEKTLIPISLVIVIGGIIFWAGMLTTKINYVEAKNSPTRAEFDNLSGQLGEINKNLTELNNYIRTPK